MAPTQLVGKTHPQETQERFSLVEIDQEDGARLLAFNSYLRLIQDRPALALMLSEIAESVSTGLAQPDDSRTNDMFIEAWRRYGQRNQGVGSKPVARICPNRPLS